MNKMQWLDSLNAQQMQIANMIVDKAEKEGVDPKLALSIAFQESRLSHGSFQKDKDGNSVFKPITGTSGEIGLMQVMPSTAKLYGYEPDELQGLDRNLEIGLKILKAHMDQYGDPRKAAAAYNSGRTTNLPESTKKYVEAIEGFGGFSPTSAAPAAPAAPAASEPSQTPPVEENQGIPLGGGDQGAPTAREPSFKEKIEEQIPRLTGAAAGATAATSLAMGKNAVSGAGLLADYMRSQIAARQAPPAVAPVAPPQVGPSSVIATPQAPIPSDGPDGGRMPKGQTGSMVYNYGKAAYLTDIEAARALDNTKNRGGVHDLTTQRREAINRITDLFPGDRYVENPRFSGVLTPDSSMSRSPRQSFTVQAPLRDVPPGTIFGPAAPPPEGTLRQLPRQLPVPTTPPPLSLLDEAIAKLGNIAKGGLRVISSAPVAGGLGGYGAVMSAEDVMERRRRGDTLGATIAGIGAGGGVLAAVPHPLAKGVGLTATVMSPLALMALDRLRGNQPQGAAP